MEPTAELDDALLQLICDYDDVEQKSLRLDQAVKDSDVALVEQCLSEGADPNYIGELNESLFVALWWSCWPGFSYEPEHFQVLELLLDNGLNPNLGLLRGGLTVNVRRESEYIDKRFEEMILAAGAVP